MLFKVAPIGIRIVLGDRKASKHFHATHLGLVFGVLVARLGELLGEAEWVDQAFFDGAPRKEEARRSEVNVLVVHDNGYARGHCGPSGKSKPRQSRRMTGNYAFTIVPRCLLMRSL